MFRQAVVKETKSKSNDPSHVNVSTKRKKKKINKFKRKKYTHALDEYQAYSELK